MSDATSFRIELHERRHRANLHNLAENDRISVDVIEFSVAVRTHRFIVLIALIILVTNLLMARRDAAARERNELRIRTLLDRRQLYADQQSFDVGTVHPFVITTVRIPFREMAARESDVTDRERETA